MARAPDKRINDAYKLYKQGVKLVEIARRLNLPAGTVRRWKSTKKWDSERSDKNNERSGKNKGAQPGNKNAEDHGAPLKNKNAEKHGLFSKYLPEETLELMNDIKNISPIDLLWDQIMIQYAAIIRAQKIMFVTDKAEMIKELKKKKDADFESGSSHEEEWNFQFAWDRQAAFLTAQSRAMAELRNMIRQYDELINANRDAVTEEQRLRIQKLKVEISILKGEGQGNDQEGINNFIKATTMKEDEIKSIFEGDNDEAIQEEE